MEKYANETNTSERYQTTLQDAEQPKADESREAHDKSRSIHFGMQRSCSTSNPAQAMCTWMTAIPAI